ncbi:MAG TPA: hypothetical protein VEA81_13535 [Burkholderiaceae bacterium]|nr:hypothetical protein [Burkholderiaceae bacterium]
MTSDTSALTAVAADLVAQREYWRREFEQALVETLAAAGCSPELARLIAGPAAVDVPRSR